MTGVKKSQQHANRRNGQSRIGIQRGKKKLCQGNIQMCGLREKHDNITKDKELLNEQRNSIKNSTNATTTSHQMRMTKQLTYIALPPNSIRIKTCIKTKEKQQCSSWKLCHCRPVEECRRYKNTKTGSSRHRIHKTRQNTEELAQCKHLSFT